jgi:putative membrane protein
MHKLRFEPYVDYDDLRGYVDFLDTYARAANMGVDPHHPKPGFFARAGDALGISFAQHNPRSLIKNAQKPLGNLPLEILIYLQSYMDAQFENKLMTVAIYQQQSSKFI